MEGDQPRLAESPLLKASRALIEAFDSNDEGLIDDAVDELRQLIDVIDGARKKLFRFKRRMS